MAVRDLVRSQHRIGAPSNARHSDSTRQARRLAIPLVRSSRIAATTGADLADGTKPVMAPWARKPNTAWQTARRKAGLPDLHVHDRRHTAGMRLREVGVPESTVAERPKCVISAR